MSKQEDKENESVDNKENLDSDENVTDENTQLEDEEPEPMTSTAACGIEENGGADDGEQDDKPESVDDSDKSEEKSSPAVQRKTPERKKKKPQKKTSLSFERKAGKREVKQVERLSAELFEPKKEDQPEFEVPKGHGTKLTDCPNVVWYLDKNPIDDLQPLYQLVFGKKLIKKEQRLTKQRLREFSGWDFMENSPEFLKRKDFVSRFFCDGLKFVCGVLDLERSGSKTDMVDRILQFLLNPQPSGRKIPNIGKKKSKGKKKGSRKRSAGGKAAKQAKSDDDDNAGSDAEDGDDDDQGGESGSGDDSLDESTSESSKEKAKATPKKTPKKASATTTPQSSKKSTAKKRKTGAAADSDSEDETPVKKKKQSGPSDNELKKVIKNILDNANLEEITMKQVCQKVQDKFPKLDIVERKPFIKALVRKLIS